jgi:glutaredoxin-dependent peroxiredoxin
MELQTAQIAPDFTLFSSEREEITLSNQKGSKVLLLFFPAAFTSVCTAELCNVRDNLKMYEGLNAKVYGISVDSVYSLAKYKEEQNLNFPLLSDFNKTASKAYNCLYDTFAFGMQGVSKRAAFVINEEGALVYAEVLENAGEQPDFNAIKNILEGA